MLLMILLLWKSARRQADKNHLGENQQQSKKEQCRKAERMWGKTKLEIHYSIYKDSLHVFNVKLATARQTFLSNFVNSNLNTHNLVAPVERLTNPPKSDSQWNAFRQQMQWVPSFLRRSVISEKRLAHPQVMQWSDRFDCIFKKKLLCLFLKQYFGRNRTTL